MKKLKILITLFVLLAFSSVSRGADKKKTYRKTQQVSFEATDVDGLVRTPDGAYVHQKKGLKFMPLYKVEKNFDREIKNSVEYLR